MAICGLRLLQLRFAMTFNRNDIMDVLEAQAKEGVDFFTIHAGVTRGSLKALNKKRRIMGIVSRGGAILASWISRHKQENPFYKYFVSMCNNFPTRLSHPLFLTN